MQDVSEDAPMDSVTAVTGETQTKSVNMRGGEAMNDEQTEKCRERLTEAVWDAFDSCTCGRSSHLSICPASEYESIQTTLDKLIKFERLDALAHQPCQWCDENPCKEWDECYGPNKTAERLLAEFVAAVLMGEVKP